MQLLLTTFFSALVTLAVIHITALKFFLYWKYMWFDIPVHVLGGACIALGYGILPFFRIKLKEHFQSFLVYILIVIAAGIIWEIFEITAGISILDEDFAADTILDLGMDILGGTIGYGIIKTIKKLEYI